MSDTRIFYGWYIVAACFALCFLFAGAGFYSFSVFIKPIENEFGWERSAISLTMSIYLIVGGLMGPVFGRLVQKYGPKRVMRVCAVCAGACFMLVGLTRSIGYFYTVYALLAVSVCGMGVIPASSLLANWFFLRRGRAVGISMVGISAGGLVLAPCVGMVAVAYGWKSAFFGIGILVWAIALPVIQWVVKDHPSEMGTYQDGRPAPKRTPNQSAVPTPQAESGRPAGQVFRSKAFWSIFVSFFLAPLAQMGVLQHQVPLIMDAGTSEAMAAAALGVTAGVGGIGKLSFGRISESWPFHYVVLLCFGLQALAVGVLLYAQSALAVWCYAIVFGFAMGGVVVLMPLVVGHFWGLISYGVLLGAIWVANSLGGALGTYASGLIYDHWGDYRYALYLFIGAYIASIVSFFIAGKPSLYHAVPEAASRR
ncbi:MFS transporter [Desulfatitalea tepidiphila]|uniref:MFS transporter n=1 Tax=Desulfatitalea tepidiphila TaxID=1185843 RepID=UPI0006B50D0B|nr:MFS transporter [Desulfatitalea tepidiphila]